MSEPFHISVVRKCKSELSVRHVCGLSFSCKHLLVLICAFEQNISASPDGKLLAVLGDSPECLLADSQSGKVSLVTSAAQPKY